MSLPTPPRYVVIPEEVIEQAYRPDKPRRALLASFTRILSLAWEAKYERTPHLNEEELIAFLKLSRRQYFEQKADMELLGWLRSVHPVPGFVQFTFSRSIIDKVAAEPGAENRTAGAENFIGAPLIVVVGGGESPDLDLNTDSPPTPLNGDGSAENRTFPSAVEILRHTDLLFDGSVVVSKSLEHCVPQEVLAWCAYAYYQFKRQRLERPAGLVRRRLLDDEHASEKMRAGWSKILPDDFLETVGLVEYECPVVGCGQLFQQRDKREEHMRVDHPLPHVCDVCRDLFTTGELLQTHIDEEHTEAPAAVVTTDESVRVPIEGGLNAERAWESVLGQLQSEMPRASFETWVRDTQAVRFRGNALSVGVRNAYARDWLKSRLTSTVERLLVGVLARSVSVEFVVAGVESPDD